MLIRPAQEDDAEAVRQVIQSVYEEYGWIWEPETYHFDLYDFKNHYLNPYCDFFVAEVDDKVVGVGGLVTFPLIQGEPGQLTEPDPMVRIAGTDCEIARLYVLKEHRGKGIGKAMNHAFITGGKKRGCQALEIWSDKRLVEAHGLYQSLGAKLVGERICNDIEQSPEWGFILPLK